MRRGLFVLALLVLATFFQSFAAAPAQAFHHHGYGWGGRWGHGWGYGGNRYYGWGGHRNWGFGRGYVYRPYYRPYYNYGYRGLGYGYRGIGYGGLGYGGYGYNSFYPGYNYGYYPSYGYSNYYNGCYCQPVYSTGYSSGVYYDTQYYPGTIYNYYGANGANGGLSTELTAGTVIAQVANALQQQRNNNSDGRLVQGRIFNGDGRLLNGDGRIREVVQNLTQGVIRNEPLNANNINVRYSNPDSRSKARAYMTQGDSLFREQRYAAAAQQYRAAASLAPDVAEANWRYAHTLVAMGEYDLAVNAVQRAIAANSDTNRNGFHLATLYGNMGTAKDAHLERLAEAALNNDSPSAHYLLGLTLHYGGEPARAEKFFAHAADLQGRDLPHMVAFLGPAPKANRAPPPLLARVAPRET